MDNVEMQKVIVDALAQIQQLSGRPLPTITRETCPLDDLPGFDSMNGMELGLILSLLIALPDRRNPCRSPDWKRKLTIGEMVDEFSQTEPAKR